MNILYEGIKAQVHQSRKGNGQMKFRFLEDVELYKDGQVYLRYTAGDIIDYDLDNNIDMNIDKHTIGFWLSEEYIVPENPEELEAWRVAAREKHQIKYNKWCAENAGKTLYSCHECGYGQFEHMSKCPQCHTDNMITMEIIKEK